MSTHGEMRKWLVDMAIRNGGVLRGELAPKQPTTTPIGEMWLSSDRVDIDNRCNFCGRKLDWRRCYIFKNHKQHMAGIVPVEHESYNLHDCDEAENV